MIFWLLKAVLFSYINLIYEPVKRLHTGWTIEGSSSSPGRVKNYHLSMSSIPVLGPAQPLIAWIPVAPPGAKQPRR
jgi:hypothetical protein